MRQRLADQPFFYRDNQMSVDPETVFNAALQLTEGERLDLAYRILDTVPEDAPGLSMDDPSFLMELRRRLADRENFVPRSELWADD
jgi:hypothetical protein